MQLLKNSLLKLMERQNITENIPLLNNYTCPDCRDTELVYLQVEGDWLAKPCRCKERKRMRKMIESSGLTETMRDKTFTSFNASPKQKLMFDTAFQYVKDYPQIKQERSNGLAFTGSVGVGKTHLLAAIANNLLIKGVGVCFVNTPGFIQELRRSQFESADKMDKQLRLLSTVEVAIFDDLAKEKATEWVQNQYYVIVNERYIHKLPTLFSTNWNIDELDDKLGEATASRLYSMTKDRMIHVQADDYRLKE